LTPVLGLGLGLGQGLGLGMIAMRMLGRVRGRLAGTEMA
jgi:hypothetical protein